MNKTKGDNHMRFKQSMNVLMIALFVWAFQSSAIHFQHHEIEEMSECSLCHASQQLDGNHHNSPTVTVNENVAVKARKHVEKVVVKPRFDYTFVQLPKQVDIVKYQQVTVEPLPLGYDAMAPPYLYS